MASIDAKDMSFYDFIAWLEANNIDHIAELDPINDKIIVKFKVTIDKSQWKGMIGTSE